MGKINDLIWIERLLCAKFLHLFLNLSTFCCYCLLLWLKYIYGLAYYIAQSSCITIFFENKWMSECMKADMAQEPNIF